MSELSAAEEAATTRSVTRRRRDHDTVAGLPAGPVVAQFGVRSEFTARLHVRPQLQSQPLCTCVFRVTFLEWQHGKAFLKETRKQCFHQKKKNEILLLCHQSLGEDKE